MEQPCIDLDYLSRFCKGDKGRMERYIRMYMESAPAMFRELIAKADQRDAEGLAVAAHSLRPQVNYMGATRLFDLLTTLERCAREQDLEACAPLLTDLQPMSEAVMGELRKALAP